MHFLCQYLGSYQFRKFNFGYSDTEDPINCEEEKKKLQQIVDAFDKDKVPPQ